MGHELSSSGLQIQADLTGSVSDTDIIDIVLFELCGSYVNRFTTALMQHIPYLVHIVEVLMTTCLQFHENSAAHQTTCIYSLHQTQQLQGQVFVLCFYPLQVNC